MYSSVLYPRILHVIYAIFAELSRIISELEDRRILYFDADAVWKYAYTQYIHTCTIYTQCTFTQYCEQLQLCIIPWMKCIDLVNFSTSRHFLCICMCGSTWPKPVLIHSPWNFDAKWSGKWGGLRFTPTSKASSRAWTKFCWSKFYFVHRCHFLHNLSGSKTALVYSMHLRASTLQRNIHNLIDKIWTEMEFKISV